MNTDLSNHKTEVGKNILKMLMFSLYPDEKTIYREYLQNACDSISEAVEKGVLASSRDGQVSIQINKYKREISIEDNGMGIPASEAEARLKDIAKTTKQDNVRQAGFYGIGRLVGAGYCESLIFQTKAKGEMVCSELQFDVIKLRNIIQDRENDSPAGEVIDQVTSFSVDSDFEQEKHFFKVLLKGVLPRYSVLLDEDAVHDYLVQVAPIPYTPEFTNNLMIPAVKDAGEKFGDYFSSLNRYRVSTDSYPSLTKLYSLNIDGTGDEIKGLRLFTLSDPEAGDLAWGWYAITQFSRAIPKEDATTHQLVKTRGIRLRSHNIQIGSEDFFGGTSYFQQPRGNKYFNGEINILHPDIIPTTDRSDLAPTDLALKLKDYIRDFFNNELQKCYEEANKSKNNIKHIFDTKNKIDNLNREALEGTITEEQKSEKLKELEKNKEKQEAQLKKGLSSKTKDSVGLQMVKKVYAELHEEQLKSYEDGKEQIEILENINKSEQPACVCEEPTAVLTDPISEKMELLIQKKGKLVGNTVEDVLDVLDKYHGQVSSKILSSMKNVILDTLIRS